MSGSKSRARAAIFFGLLAIAAIPAGAVVSWQRPEVHLLQAELVAVPVAFVCGLIALAASRRARYRVERSVRRAGERTARAARWLAWTGLYVAVTGGLALAFYGVLRASS
jgi:hypothetical protein